MQEQERKFEEIDILRDQEHKNCQTDFLDKELISLKEKVKHFELVEAAYDEELSARIDENSRLSQEVSSLKSTIDELLLNKGKDKIRRQDSSLEFEALKGITEAAEESEDIKENVQQDLMSELRSYEEKLKDKELEIASFDDKLKEKDKALEKLHKILDFNNQFLVEIQAMNKMIDKKTKGAAASKEEESLDQGQNFQESLEPETLQDFSQVFSVMQIKYIIMFFAASGNAEIKRKH